MNDSLSSPHRPDSLLGRFLHFLRRPYYTVNVPKKQQGRPDVPRLYALALLIVLPLGIFSSMVASNLQTSNAIEDFARTIPLGQIVMLAVVLAPLWEEAAFRLPLRYTPANVAIPMSLGLFLLMSTVLSTHVLPTELALPFLGGIFVVGTILWFRLKAIEPKKIHIFYEKRIGWLFYGLAIAFGLIHLGNFSGAGPQAWVLAPLLVLPQTALGFFLGYIRLQYGFWWAVFTHSFHNACAITPLLLMRLGSENLISSIDQGMEPQNLVGTDYVIVMVLITFIMGGLLLCLITVCRLIAEWYAEKQQIQV